MASIRFLALTTITCAIAISACHESTDVPVATSVQLSPYPTATVTAGATLQFTATVLDQHGAPMPGLTAIFDLSATAVGSIDLVTGLFTSSGTAGTATVTAHAGQLTASTQVTVVSGEPYQITFVRQPPTTVVNRVPFTTPTVLQVMDRFGNAVAAAGLVITASLSGPGTLTGASAVTGADGTATFSNLSFAGKTGPQSIAFTVQGMSGGQNAVVNVLSGSPAIILIDAGNNQTAAAGNSVARAPSVLITDMDGNVSPSTTVHFVVASGAGSVTGADAITNANGIATVGSWTLGLGSNTLFASVNGMSAAVFFSATGKQPFGGFAAFATGPADVFSCALSTTGTAYCWPAVYGQDVVPTIVSDELRFQNLAVGNQVGCGVTLDGKAYCWGNASWLSMSQVYQPVPVQSDITFTSLAVGADAHACGLATGGIAYCWGQNDAGQLGDGTTASSSSRVRVIGGLTFKVLAAGDAHTCGLTISGAAYCWGDKAALGDGASTNSSVPVPVSGGLSFETITAGTHYTCGLVNGGDAYCWGGTLEGSLGNGSMTDYNPTPRPVVGGLRFQSIAASGSFINDPNSDGTHTCAVTTDNLAKCWGVNGNGELGDGTNSQRFAPVAVSGALEFQSVVAGNRHSCGITTNQKIYCWGDNMRGQLGVGVGRGQPLGSSTPIPVVPPAY